MGKRQKYSAEFKREAVARSDDPSVTQSQIAQELGIRANMLGRWSREVKELGTQAFRGHGKPRDEEIQRLTEPFVIANRHRYSLYPRCSISTFPQCFLRYSATRRL